jgi:hypothetical protein
MLANAMLADPLLTTIPVNIFAIDPVPGMGNFQTEKVTLGRNVKEYVAFYARDERSKGFRAWFRIPTTQRQCIFTRCQGDTRRWSAMPPQMAIVEKKYCMNRE